MTVPPTLDEFLDQLISLNDSGEITLAECLQIGASARIMTEIGRIADALESIIDAKASDGEAAARIRRVWE